MLNLHHSSSSSISNSFNCIHLYVIQTGTEQITQADITTTVRELSIVQLKNLYEKLGIEPQDVEKAEESSGSIDPDLRAKGVLRMWLSRNGRDATRIKILLGLKQLGQKKSLQALQAKWNIHTV